MTTKPKNRRKPAIEDQDFLADIDALIESIDASLANMDESADNETARDDERP